MNIVHVCYTKSMFGLNIFYLKINMIRYSNKMQFQTCPNTFIQNTQTYTIASYQLHYNIGTYK